MNRLKMLGVAVLLALCAGNLQAACTTPAGNAGQVIYNGTYNVIQYCNGNNWINTGTKNASAANTGCSNPTGKRGDVVFNGTAKVHQFCNGEAWMNMACSQIAASSGSGCTNPTAPRGALAYVTPANKLQMCDGVKWLNTGVKCPPVDPCAATSPASGTVCMDGTQYVGLSPDGNVKMFTTRCDSGMTWDGANCTGTRQDLAWARDSYPQYTGYNNYNTGRSNTAGILTSYSFPDAAKYCDELIANGRTDWYLPALNELKLIDDNQNSISGLDINRTIGYWSSTEAGENSALMKSFHSDNSQYTAFTQTKSPRYHVRCTRR